MATLVLTEDAQFFGHTSTETVLAISQQIADELNNGSTAEDVAVAYGMLRDADEQAPSVPENSHNHDESYLDNLGGC